MKEKAIYNKSGMKQIINTGFKEFDKQTNVITTGNVFANTQASSYIRSYHETECNGFTFEKGSLQDHDLKPFKSYLAHNEYNLIKDWSFGDGGILYMFFIRNKKKEIDPIGFVLTDKNHKELLYLVKYSYESQHEKRFNALQEVKKYITL